MSKIDLATYVAKVEVNTDGLSSGLNQADGQVKSSLDKTFDFAKVKVAALKTALVAGVGKLAKEIVNIGSTFESGMSEVAAISGATGDDLDALTAKAKEMGATTKFSASDSAEALKYMAMAGWDTSQMLDGLDGVMNLAAASGEDLGLVSDIVTDALSAFGMEAKQSSEFADLLASTASNSNTNVAMMGESFKYVAPIAGALGYSAEDTALALGLLANNGIKGSQAGTTLKNIMTGLSNPTKQSAVAMQNLGVEVANADGSMRPFKDVLGDLRSGFAELTPEQQASTAEAIAGKQGMAGLLAIMNSTDEEFEQLTDATRDYNGAAAEMAEIMEDNLQGDLTKLKSALEGVAIMIYEVLSPALRAFTQIITGVVNVALTVLTSILDGLQKGLAPLGDSFARLGEIFGETFAFVGEYIGEYISKLSELSEVIGSTIASALEPFLEKLGETIVSLGRIIEPIFKIIEILRILALEILVQMLIPAIELVGGMLEIAITVINNAVDTIANVVERISEFLQQLVEENEEQLGRIVEIIKSITDLISQIISVVIDTIKQILSSFFSENESNVEGHSQTIFNIVNTILGLILDIIEFTLGLIKDVLTVAMQIIEGDWSTAWEGIKNIVSTVWEGIKTVVKTAIDAVVGILKNTFGTMKETAKLLFTKIWEAAKEVLSSLLSWITKPISDIISSFTKQNGKAKSAGRSMFQSVWDGMKGIWSSLASWVSSKVSWLTDKLAFWRSSKAEMSTGGGSIGGFAVGTPFVSHDQTALIHKGEAIIPQRYNPFTKGGHFKPEFAMAGGGGGNSTYQVEINVANANSEIDIERAVKKGIQKAEEKKKRNIKKRGV